MQPRRQPQPASRPGGRRPAAQLFALLLLLLLLLDLEAVAVAVAVPAGAGGPEDAGLGRGLLQQAAQAALHFFNFRAGSPSALRVLASVQEGRAWVNPEKGCKVELVFSTERYNPQEGEEHLGKCSAQVFFKNQKPRPAINVTCTRLIEKKKRQQEDYLLYKQMKQLKNPLDVVSIPDSHGHIDPSLRPMWDLAFLGSSYVMWEKTTRFSRYNLAQLSSVKQWSLPWNPSPGWDVQHPVPQFCNMRAFRFGWRLLPLWRRKNYQNRNARKTHEGAIDFDYTVLLHEFLTQEIIPCRIHLVWYPGKPLKVKYNCQELQTPEGSGTEEGSAVAPAQLSNF